MKLFGWALYVTPGPIDEATGFSDVTWEIFETLDGGIDSVEAQLPLDWLWERCDFGFADDMRDYAGLDGVTIFRQFNGPENVQYGPLMLGKHDVAAEFLMCGHLDGKPIPLHNEAQAHEVIAWFVQKQATWYEQYSKQSDGQASEKDGQAPEADIGGRTAQRRKCETVH